MKMALRSGLVLLLVLLTACVIGSAIPKEDHSKRVKDSPDPADINDQKPMGLMFYVPFVMLLMPSAAKNLKQEDLQKIVEKIHKKNANLPTNGKFQRGQKLDLGDGKYERPSRDQGRKPVRANKNNRNNKQGWDNMDRLKLVSGSSMGDKLIKPDVNTDVHNVHFVYGEDADRFDASSLGDGEPSLVYTHAQFKRIYPHMSEHDHYDEEGHHNPEFDHDAFLGEDEAKEFDKLDPEESKRRLGLIYDKIDTKSSDGQPGDGKVDQTELLQWIKHVQNKYLETDARRQWEELGHSGEQLTWKHYREKSYGGLDNPEDTDSEEFQDAVKMERRDKKRFARADRNGDGHLDQEEFTEFIHPEESKNMKDLVVEETLEDIDKDGDGFISLDEYIGDMWTAADGEPEPDWVERERKNFKEKRDKNEDGNMDKEEVALWIMPEGYDHMEIEARHLMREADTDKDGILTKDEVLAKHDVFAGSQATDYGDAIARHDEF